MFEPHEACLPAPAHWLSALGERSGAFALDRRFAGALTGPPEQVPDEHEAALAERQQHEAIEQAYAQGLATGRAEAAEAAATQHTVVERLRLSMSRIDETLERAFADRLAGIVIDLCEATLQPLVRDRDALERRCIAAAGLLADEQERRTLHLNPEDIAALDPAFAAAWTIIADAALERGDLRVEGAEVCIADGPTHWRGALQAALAC